MHIEIRGKSNGIAYVHAAKRALREGFARIARYVPRVQLRLANADGEATCRLICELRSAHPGQSTEARRALVVEASSDDILDAVAFAIDRAIERVSRAMGLPTNNMHYTHIVLASGELLSTRATSDWRTHPIPQPQTMR
jgi:hypothetical protein